MEVQPEVKAIKCEILFSAGQKGATFAEYEGFGDEGAAGCNARDLHNARRLPTPGY